MQRGEIFLGSDLFGLSRFIFIKPKINHSRSESLKPLSEHMSGFVLNMMGFYEAIILQFGTIVVQ